MKKWIMLLACLTMLTACWNRNEETELPAPNEPVDISLEEKEGESLKISDIFPYFENVSYQYDGIGNDYAAWNIFVDHINGNRIQRRISVGDMQVVEVLEYENGRLMLRYSEVDFRRHEDVTDYEPNTAVIILQEPIELGMKWEMATGEIAEVTNMDAEVETPYATYKSVIEVTTTTENSISKDYYVRGLGHVKSERYETGVGESSTQLAYLEEDAKLEAVIDLYLYDVMEDTMVTEERTLSIRTNDDIVAILNAELKKTNLENMQSILSENAEIRSIEYLPAVMIDDLQANAIRVDLSKEYISEMNVGASIESRMVQSLRNTLGNFYHAGYVSLVIEGGDVESGHVISAVDEFIAVTREGADE